MNSEERPLPETILKAIKKEESQRNKGRLKIFIGMAPGVGKTYAMLEEAQQLHRSGVAVSVGVVETHGRQETAKLLEGLTIIPKKNVLYRDKEFQEMDVDAILAAHPQIVLVDELAHTNVPGLRHAKRWQDVMELLDNGVNVYTTLNVQHIESQKDLVEGIAEISVHETVPNLIIETAADIQVVDLSPEQLLNRLKDGKIYLQEQSAIAILNFFQKERLTALREIALRFAAEKVDRDLAIMSPTTDKIKGWKPRERLLVAINESLHSQQLIRTTKRLAFTLDAPWMAVYVDTGTPRPVQEANDLEKNLALARELGAEVITTIDTDVISGLRRIAKQRGITQIVVGRTIKRFYQGSSVADRVYQTCNDFDIHIVREEAHPGKSTPKKKRLSTPFSWKGYLGVFFCVCCLTGINWLLLPIIGYKVVGVIFLIGILSLSLVFKKGPVLFASMLYALIWDILFIPPFGMIAIASHEDTALLALYLLTAISTGILVDRARQNTSALLQREETIQSLYDIVRLIASSSSTEQLLHTVETRLAQLFQGVFKIFGTNHDNQLLIDVGMPLLTDEKEKAAATWVFEHGKEAGWCTDTLPSVKNLYLPVKDLYQVVGVLAYRPGTVKMLDSEQKNFLYTVCQQLANYLQRSIFYDRHIQNEQLKQIETIYRTVLERISHELKHPLYAIKAAAQAIQRQATRVDSSFIQSILASSDGLIKILSNISAMAQLSEGLVPLNKKKHSIKELVAECCDNIKKTSTSHQINYKITDIIPDIFFDFQLIQILLYNLLHNAIEYSPPQSVVDVEVKKLGNWAVISVADQGKGIPEDHLGVIFEKFYRLPDSTSPGIGLGLAIAKTIAELHQGYLKVENLPEKGAEFSLYLPIM